MGQSREGTHYRRVEVRIWNDEKFRHLSLEGASVFFHLLSHPDLRPYGAIRSSEKGLAAEYPFFDSKRYAKGFAELLAKGFVVQSANGCFIRLKNFLKYNFPDNKNFLISWINSLEYLPECSERTQLLQDF